MADTKNAESLGRRTARTLSAVLIGQLISIIITGITIIVLARLLQPYLYGQYTFAFGYASLIDAVGGLGVGAYLNRNFAIWAFKRDHGQMMRVLSSSILIFTISALLITLLAIGLSGIVAKTIYSSLKIPEITLITSSLMIFFVMAQSVEMHALIGLGKGSYSSGVSILGNTMQLVASVGLFLYGLGVEGVLIGMLLGYITSAVCGALLIRRSLLKIGPISLVRPKLKELKEVARFAFPIGLNNLLNDGMQNFSILFLGLFVSETLLGNYGAALKGLAAVILLHNSINNVLLPAFSTARLERKKEGLHRTYNKVLRYSLLLVMPVIAFIAVFSRQAIYLFLSRSYYFAPTYLSLMLVGAAINTVSLFISSLIVSHGDTIKVLKYNTAIVLIELASIALIVPEFNAYGGVYAVFGAIVSIFIIGSIFSFAFFARGANSLIGIKFEYGKLARLYASALALGIVLMAIPYAAGQISPAPAHGAELAAELLAGLAAAILIYPPISIFTGALSREDLESLRDATSKLPVIGALADSYFGYAAIFA
ncbi:MAG: oligosaccharide flippase family protein [Candidatus Micrarchaeaceae archaeon]